MMKRLWDKVSQRAVVKQQKRTMRGSANTHYKGTLSIVLRSRSTGIPSICNAGFAFCKGMINAASLSGQNPILQHNGSE